MEEVAPDALGNPEFYLEKLFLPDTTLFLLDSLVSIMSSSFAIPKKSS
jgi:hypothetical protein